MFKIGMRNVKTGISVFLCVLISKILKLEYPFYAAIAAIISMQTSAANTFKVGRNRMLGTLVGACVGLAFASIQPDNAILCGLGIIILIYICNLLEWNASISIAGVVFIAIMVNLNGKSPVLYSFNRLIDTFIGLSVALAVNYLIYPYDNTDKINSISNSLADKISLSINQIVGTGAQINLDGINKNISDLSKQLDIYITEFKSRKTVTARINRTKRRLELYNDIHEHLKMIKKMGEGRELNDENIEKLKSLNFIHIVERDYSNNELNIVYNYHIRSIIEDLQNINAEI